MRFKIRGTEICINPYFMLMLLIYLFLGVFFQALLAFVLVFFHELAHAAMARKCGMTISRIEVFPFGGVARLEGLLVADPVKEIKVALAGPLSNFLLVMGALFLTKSLVVDAYWLFLFCQLNLVLGVINLLPGLPLDGGRVAQALLATRLGVRQATVTAAIWGQLVALMIGTVTAVGLIRGTVNIHGFILAGFVFLAARQEGDLSTYLFLRYLSRKPQEFQRRGLMNSSILVVTPETQLGDMVERLLPRRYHLIALVSSEGTLERFFTETEIVDFMLRKGKGEVIGKLK